MTTLCDIIAKYGGLIQTGPFGSQLHEYEYTEVGVPVVMPKDIVCGKINYEGIARIPEEKAVQLQRHKLQAGDIVFPRRGDIGKCAFVTKADEGTLCGTGCLKITVPENMLLPRFLFYFLGLSESVKWLENNSTGSTMMNLNTNILGRIEIPDEPIEEQRRIADILSSYDDLIENNRRRIAIIEETARLAYRKWFDEVEQNKNETLGDICYESKHGVSPDEIAPDMPYIGLEHMPRRSISLCEWDTVQKVTSTKLAFDAGDILFGKIRPYFHKVGIAFVDGVASSDAIVIKPLRPEWQAYVLMIVSSDAFVATASQGMKEGSKMPRADWKQLLNYPVAIPDPTTLTVFNRILMPILEQLKVLCFSIRNLASTRDMLVPKLMKDGI